MLGYIKQINATVFMYRIYTNYGHSVQWEYNIYSNMVKYLDTCLYFGIYERRKTLQILNPNARSLGSWNWLFINFHSLIARMFKSSVPFVWHIMMVVYYVFGILFVIPPSWVFLLVSVKRMLNLLNFIICIDGCLLTNYSVCFCCDSVLCISWIPWIRITSSCFFVRVVLGSAW